MALDNGITEVDFWDMTIAEINRYIESKIRVKKAKDQEKAYFDYTLADLIGRSVARIYSSSNRLPDIAEAYPKLFDSEEMKRKKQEQIDNLSAARFKQFAQTYNNKREEGKKE